MKKMWILLVAGCLFLLPNLVQAQADKLLDRFFPGQRLRPGDLQIVDLDISPDPAREGQRVIFRVKVANRSDNSGRVTLILKDKDEVIGEARDVQIRPGESRIDFPESNYRFSRRDHCFTVEVDIERSRRPLDVAKEFCARRTPRGWTLGELKIGPLYVEDLEMNPDPIRPGQEIQLTVRLRNDGRPNRADLRVQDRDEIVARVDDVHIPRGVSEFRFPVTRYNFQRSDHCLTVVVDVDREPYVVEAAREFCAKKAYRGWTLRELKIGPLYVEDLSTYPDPIRPGQDARFAVRLRNDGRPNRADIWIQDKDETVARVENVQIPRGVSEFQFPVGRYTFQRFDHCFTVVVNVERTPYPVDAAREFCAKPMGWSLRP